MAKKSNKSKSTAKTTDAPTPAQSRNEGYDHTDPRVKGLGLPYPYGTSDQEDIQTELAINRRARSRRKGKMQNAAHRSGKIGKQLGKVSKKYTKLTKELAGYDNMGQTLKMFKDIANASYLSNSDIIEQRRALREALYGERGYKPENMDMLTQSQQANVNTANRSGLVAGIQALNETENARNTRVEDLTQEQKDLMESKRNNIIARGNMLSQQANVLSQRENVANDRLQYQERNFDRARTRRDTLEARQNTISDNDRTFALTALQNYPSLAGLLTPAEMDSMQRGQLTDAIREKISHAINTESAASTASENITMVQTATSIMGIDKTTGKVIYNIPIPGGSSGGGGGYGSGSGSTSSGSGSLWGDSKGNLTVDERAALRDRNYYSQNAYTDPEATEYLARIAANDPGFGPYWINRASVTQRDANQSQSFGVGELAAAYADYQNNNGNWTVPSNEGGMSDYLPGE